MDNKIVFGKMQINNVLTEELHN